LFFGERLWVCTGESTSRGLLSFGYAEAALTALMLHTIRPGMRVVDVGAHFGYEAVLASVLVGDSGRVVSFEPQAGIACWTSRSLSRFPHARVVCAAVSDTCGTADFVQLDIRRSAFSCLSASEPVGASSHKVSVPVTTLEQALKREERPVDFLKCDVEGAELAVLRGARKLIECERPLIVLEAGMAERPATALRVAEFTAFLEPLGYRGMSFEFDDGLLLAPPGTLKAGHANVAFVPRDRAEFEALLRS
jgi:FkbM family methyltransferase